MFRTAGRDAALSISAMIAFCGQASAQEAGALAAVPDHSAFIFNTLLFLIGGMLVMFMACGFAMLEAGLVRQKNVAMQLTKNVALFSLSGIMFWLFGYQIMYPGDAGWIIPIFSAPRRSRRLTRRVTPPPRSAADIPRGLIISSS